MHKYMMATKAIHKLGDISRDEPDLCFIHREDGENYIGNWVTGFGFVEVKFPKETTRDLTEAEENKFDGMHIQISNQPPMELKIK
jgi:methyl coenzyme M reductase gamma subunit